MATTTLPAPTSLDTTSDAIVHTFCCDENRSLCGLDISTEPFTPDSDPAHECVVCFELDEAGGPCGVPGCGQ